MILDIARQILDYNEEYDARVLYIAKTGSQIFRNNPNDLDFLVIVDKLDTVSSGRLRRAKKVNGVRHDMIFWELQAIERFLSFEDTTEISKPLNKMYAYMFLEPYRQTVFNSGEVVIPEFNMFEVKNQYVGILKTIMFEHINRVLDKEIGMGKFFVHLYVVLKVYENNSLELTQTMIDDANNLYNSTNNFRELCHWIENKLLE